MSRFFLWFKEMKQLYGFCPCCHELFRLSDADLFIKERAPRTPFDELAARRARLDRQIERFEDRELEVREDARIRGRKKAARKLRKIAPHLYDRAVNPNDIKVIFDPVEYMVFHGLTKERCTLIELVDHPTKSPQREKVQRSIDAAIKAGNIEWQTFRVELDGRVSAE